jgi:hypothetical protein
MSDERALQRARRRMDELATERPETVQDWIDWYDRLEWQVYKPLVRDAAEQGDLAEAVTLTAALKDVRRIASQLRKERDGGR